MRLTMMSLSLVFVSMTMLAQQPNAADQKASHDVAGKTSAAPRAHATRAHHRAVRKKYSSRRRHAGRRAEYRPEYSQNSVEVMNGASTQKVVFHDDEPAKGSRKNAGPAPMKVEVVNGTSRDTQYFAAGQGTGQSNPAEHKQPVVVAIQSSDTRVVGGNKHPVVTGITAVQPGSAKRASGGQNGTTGISPQPKRPAYQPDAH